MDVKIFSQRECNYRQIQDTMTMLNIAVREVDASAQPDIARALHLITLAVTGTNKNLFFAIAEVDGVAAGFIAGSLMEFAFETRTLGQDIFVYVAPNYRHTDVAKLLTESFSDWCFALGANEVRRTFLPTDNAVHLSMVAKELGYQEIGKVFSLKRQIA